MEKVCTPIIVRLYQGQGRVTNIQGQDQQAATTNSGSRPATAGPKIEEAD